MVVFVIALLIQVLIFKLPIALLLAKKVVEPATCTIIYVIYVIILSVLLGTATTSLIGDVISSALFGFLFFWLLYKEKEKGGEYYWVIFVVGLIFI